LSGLSSYTTDGVAFLFKWMLELADRRLECYNELIEVVYECFCDYTRCHLWICEMKTTRHVFLTSRVKSLLRCRMHLYSRSQRLPSTRWSVFVYMGREGTINDGK
jgi:hypothetical protein